MFVNPKDSIIAIMGPILSNQKSPRSDQELMSKIGVVSQILQEHPELKNDREVYGCLVSATENSTDKKIIQFRRSLIVGHCLPNDNKTEILTITKDDLNQLTTDELWVYIEKQCIKSLVISIESESVIYDNGFLKRLLQYKPEIMDLTDMYTLLFDEVRITISKAKLRLCGTYFETALDSGMTESANKKFQFGNIIKGFDEILHAIEMEEYNFSKSSEEFTLAAEYFQFYAEFEFPEGIFGKDLLEKHLGNVGEVPLPSKELIKAMEAPCPFSNDANQKTKDTHIITWVPPKVGNDKLSPSRLDAVINPDKSGSFDRSWTAFIPKGEDEEAKEGYWLIMLKKPLEATKNLTYEVAEHHVQDNYKNYDIPTVKDAMLCVVLNCVCSGEKKERRIARRDNPLNNTWCKENGKLKSGTVWHIIVGAPASLDLYVGNWYSAHNSIGVCPVRKFLSN